MTLPHRVALIGFNDFERTAFESCFRLNAGRAACLVAAHEIDEATLLVVDADNAAAASDPRAAPERSIYIGARGRDGQLGHLPRPINVTALTRLLEGIAPRTPAQPRPAPMITLPAGSMQSALVVDEDEVTLRFMATVLGRSGFDVQLARSGDEALRRLAATQFEFVFLEVALADIDGHQVCKQIKQRAYPPERHAPAVVMLTHRVGVADKVRARMAGCDAYLTKPLQPTALLQVIGERVITTWLHAETALSPLAAA